MMQKRELASTSLPDSKTQKEKENEMNLFNSLNQVDSGLMVRIFPPPPPLARC